MLPVCHIKATTRTVKTGRNRCSSAKHVGEIFGQRIGGNLHVRQDMVAKRSTRVSRAMQDDKEIRQDHTGQRGKELWQSREVM
jgi:hypothetical protein